MREKKGTVYVPETIEFVEAIPLTAYSQHEKKTLCAPLASS
jgi:hypothetical protein